jgi:hypothetical protein
MPKLPGRAAQKSPVQTNIERLQHEMIVHPRCNPDDVTILAVDPGGARASKNETGHVGVALGSRYFYDAGGLNEFTDYPKIDGPRWALQSPGWRVYDVAEMTPIQFVHFFRRNIEQFDIVTCEKFQLYPTKAKEQFGSEMPTSKLIGWIEFSIQIWNETWESEHGGRTFGYPQIHYESHLKEIHKGTAAVLKHEGIEYLSPATPDHARSAELHLWHTLIRNQLVEGVTLR